MISNNKNKEEIENKSRKMMMKIMTKKINKQ